MPRVIANAWVSGASYTANISRVMYRGIVFVANTTHNGITTNPLEDETNWRVESVFRIQDYYSLIESVRLAINTDDDSINNSIPMFIQLAEQSFSTRLRVPAMLQRETVTVTANNTAPIPDNLLQVENVRLRNNDIGGGDGDFNSLLYNGRYEINSANYYEFQLIQQRYDSDIDFFDAVSSTQFRSMVYWNDGTNLHFAPSLEAGTQIEIVFYGQLTPLGYPILLTNAAGEPINSAEQTQAEWVAAGNSADSFVQADGIQETNWFLQAAPRMVMYGAIMQAEQYLKDDQRWPAFQQQFAQAENEIMELVEKFDQDRSSSQYFRSHYPT